MRLRFSHVWIILITLCLLVSACEPAALPRPAAPVESTAISLQAQEALPTPRVTILPQPAPTLQQTPAPTEAPALALTPTATADPYAGLTIADLSARAYGEGELQIIEFMGAAPAFNRYLIAYPSDGLTIYGFMNLPNGGGPFPVIIASHGYIDPEIYTTLDYTTYYADALAAAGYLVLHPNLRGYQPSDDGPNMFRVGMAVDVLNLIALLQAQGGQPGPLEQADPARTGLWGHSMGGGISTRAITVSPAVRAAVLYGAMSGDDRQNYERIFYHFSDQTRGLEELDTPLADFLRISPIYFLDRIQAAVSIHHGENDDQVPLDWSLDLCARLQELGKPVECFTYPGQPHTFAGDGRQLFIQRTIDFFDRHLKNP